MACTSSSLESRILQFASGNVMFDFQSLNLDVLHSDSRAATMMPASRVLQLVLDDSPHAHGIIYTSKHWPGRQKRRGVPQSCRLDDHATTIKIAVLVEFSSQVYDSGHELAPLGNKHPCNTLPDS